jgi:hypothetical protein
MGSLCSSAALGQPILPTDKHNPAFTLFRTGSGGDALIHVYYGLELLEVVPDDRQDPMFRSMVARLRNAGLKLKSLVETFELDPKTIRSWGDALKSRDPERMQAMLFGPHAARKLTLAISSYVAKRLPELLAHKCKDYRATLQREIATFFDTRLSTETLRLLISEAKAKSSELAAMHDPSDFTDAAASPAAAADNTAATNVAMEDAPPATTDAEIATADEATNEATNESPVDQSLGTTPVVAAEPAIDHPIAPTPKEPKAGPGEEGVRRTPSPTPSEKGAQSDASSPSNNEATPANASSEPNRPATNAGKSAPFFSTSRPEPPATATTQASCSSPPASSPWASSSPSPRPY